MSKRRDLLKALSIAGTTGTIAQWKTPVVDAMILPSHARTTCGEQRCPESTERDCSIILTCEESDDFAECMFANCLRPEFDCEEAPCDFSDIRLKSNIRKLDCPETEFQLYRFQYLSDSSRKTYVGVMAQDLELTHPEAIVQGSDGFYRVRYHSLGLKMATLEEWENKGSEAVLLH